MSEVKIYWGELFTNPEGVRISNQDDTLSIDISIDWFGGQDCPEAHEKLKTLATGVVAYLEANTPNQQSCSFGGASIPTKEILMNKQQRKELLENRAWRYEHPGIFFFNTGICNIGINEESLCFYGSNRYPGDMYDSQSLYTIELGKLTADDIALHSVKFLAVQKRYIDFLFCHGAIDKVPCNLVMDIGSAILYFKLDDETDHAELVSKMNLKADEIIALQQEAWSYKPGGDNIVNIIQRLTNLLR